MFTGSIILVHSGQSSLPDYLFDNLKILLFLNPNVKIYLIADLINYDNFVSKSMFLNDNQNSIEFISDISFSESLETKEFKSKSSLNQSFRDGFWFHTSLRFFLINDFITSKSLNNVLHIENDYILYKDPQVIINACASLSDFMVPLDNYRAIPGIVWIKDFHISSKLVKFLLVNSSIDDMTNLGNFTINNDFACSFPTISPNFAKEHNLNVDKYSVNFDSFEGIFDAAAIGQYLDGVHWLNDISDTKFFQNESSPIIMKSNYITWNIFENKKLPFFNDGSEIIPILGLHIHSKNIRTFSPFYNSYIDNIDDYITGEKIQSLATTTITSNTIINFHGLNNIKSRNIISITQFSDFEFSAPTIENINLLNESKIIFTYTHFIPYFINFISNKIYNPYILITHNSDDEIDISYLSLLNSSNLVLWFCQNSRFNHDKIRSLPIGLQNMQWNPDTSSLIHKCSRTIIKSKNIYVNFNENTHSSRKLALNIAKSLPSCTIESNISFNIYINNLSKHKFSICPRGNGIDTHRFWECQYLNVIPIIVKEDWTQSYSNFPCLLIDEWTDLLDLNLNDEYIKINSRHFDNILKISDLQTLLK